MRACMFLFMVLMILMTSCENKMPSYVISQNKMENVLYDYHLAKALSLQSKNPIENERLYTDAVLKKYGITKADFDSSMVWYARNTETLFEIYKKVNSRYEAMSKSLGGSVSAVQSYSSMTAKGDTANVWNDRNFCILTPTPLTNRFCFSVKADSSFHLGDKITWHFNVEFVYREGARDAVAVLCVRYDNDSVSTTEQRIMGNGERSLHIETARLPIKSVEGFVYLSERYSATPKLMIVSLPSLIKMHTKELPKTEGNSASSDSLVLSSDSAKQRSAVDSASQPKRALFPKRHNMEREPEKNRKPHFI